MWKVIAPWSHPNMDVVDVKKRPPDFIPPAIITSDAARGFITQTWMKKLSQSQIFSPQNIASIGPGRILFCSSSLITRDPSITASVSGVIMFFLSAAFCTAGVQRRNNTARKRRRRSIPSCVNQLRSKTLRIKQQNVVFVISSTATSVVTNRCYKMIKLWLNYKLSSKALHNLHPIHTAAAVRRRASCWPDRRD